MGKIFNYLRLISFEKQYVNAKIFYVFLKKKNMLPLSMYSCCKNQMKNFHNLVFVDWWSCQSMHIYGKMCAHESGIILVTSHYMAWNLYLLCIIGVFMVVLECAVRPQNHECGLCFVLLPVKFTLILQGYFTGTEAIIWLPQCQWSNPGGYG